jgi:hypothetical protein
MSRVHFSRTCDLIELIVGYGVIIGIIWSPEHLQRILSPMALVLTLLLVLARRPSRDELGFGWRGSCPQQLRLRQSAFSLRRELAHYMHSTRPILRTFLAMCFGPFISNFFYRILSWTDC